MLLHRDLSILPTQMQLQNAGMAAKGLSLIGDKVAHRPHHWDFSAIFRHRHIVSLEAVGMAAYDIVDAALFQIFNNAQLLGVGNQVVVLAPMLIAKHKFRTLLPGIGHIPKASFF